MWIHSRYGHYSVVAHRDDPETLIVRARSHRELVDLLNLHPDVVDVGDLLVVPTPENDYAYRAFVTRRTFADLLLALGEDVTYPSFKDAARERLGDGYYSYLTQVWSDGVQHYGTGAYATAYTLAWPYDFTGDDDETEEVVE